jgi:hypothetical protein
MADVIQEFLISLGFRIDEPGQKRMQQAIAASKGSKQTIDLGFKVDESNQRRMNAALLGVKENVGKLTTEFVGMGTTAVAAMEKISEQYSALYFLSQRANTAASAMDALGFASKFATGNALTLQNVVVRLAEQFRSIPQWGQNIQNVISSVTGRRAALPRTPEAAAKEVMQFFADQIKAGPQAEQIAKLVAPSLLPGVDYESQIRPLAANWDLVKAAEERARETAKRWGVDIDKVAEQSRQLDQQFDTLGNTVDRIKTKMFSAWAEPMIGALKEMNSLLDRLGDQFHKLSPEMQDVIAKSVGAGSVAVGGGLGGWLLWRLGRRLLGGAARAPLPPPMAPAGGGLLRFGLRRIPQLAALLGGYEAGSALEPSVRQSATGAALLDTVGGAIAKAWLSLFGGSGVEVPEAIKQRMGGLPGPALGGAMGLGGSFDIGRELSDWLHGSTSLVPQVKLADQFNLPPGAGMDGSGGGRGGRPQHGDILGLGGAAVLPGNWGTGLPPGVSNVSKAIDFFAAHNLTAPQIAGVIGVLQQESGRGLNPLARNPSGALGVAQWMGSRQRGFGPDLQSQLERIWQEWQGPEHLSFERLKAATTPAQAALAMRGFERGGTYGGLDIAAAERLLPSIHPSQFGPQIPTVNHGDRTVHVGGIDNRTTISLAEGGAAQTTLSDMISRQNRDMVRNLVGAVR